ncbi:MAG: sensor histidine kinase [Candidatus Ornithomonoglobus sp.]
MKIRQRFESYNFILLTAPIAIIGVVSVLFLIIFVMKFPVEEMQITRASLINPVTLTRAVGAFFTNHPAAVTYIITYALICIAVCAVTSTILTRRLSQSLEKPIRELRDNVDKIREGSLSFEVMGSDYDELDDLCEGFDSMRRELLLAREREEQLKHERNMLIANISHDLKTPVTSIKGYIDGINDGIADTPEKLERYLNTIKSKADTIDELVSNLSTFAKLEVSGLEFSMSRGDLRDLVLDVMDGYRLDMERNGIETHIDLGTEALWVNIDGEKMRRVLTNLIDNSIKYRNPEGCLIEVRCFADEGSAYAAVKDNGMGIEPKELSRVFDSFYRTDSSRSSQIKGNGLGLGIAKQITEKHRGRLWLRSDGINKGTTATISLPLAEDINK